MHAKIVNLMDRFSKIVNLFNRIVDFQQRNLWLFYKIPVVKIFDQLNQVAF